MSLALSRLANQMQPIFRFVLLLGQITVYTFIGETWLFNISVDASVR